MAKNKTGHLVERLGRKERGTALPVTTRRISLKGGKTAQLQLINLSNADVPDRSYFGETCGVEHLNRTIRLMFSQPKLGGAGLRSLVLVSMTEAAAAHFSKSLREMGKPTLEEIVGTADIAEGRLADLPKEEPEQTASLIANIVAVAVHGQESCLDFYHANAFSHLSVQTTNQMYLEPVVRVNVSTSLLWALLRRLEQLRNDFHPDALLVEEVADE